MKRDYELQRERIRNQFRFGLYATNQELLNYIMLGILFPLVALLILHR